MLSTLPPYPLRGDPMFAAVAATWNAALPVLTAEINALVAALNNIMTTATSVTGDTISMGSTTITVDTGKSFQAGMTVKIAYTTTPTIWMLGDVTAYNPATGALTVSVQSTQGAGTYAAWTISLAATGGVTVSELQAFSHNTCIAAGTADAITVGFTPAVTAFTNGPIWWRAGFANASTVPTVQRDALAAKTLVKGNGLALVTGDVPGAGAWMCSLYDPLLDKEVLLNPATGVIAIVTATSDPTFVDNSAKKASTGWVRGAMSAIAVAAGFVASFAANGYVKFPSFLGGLIIQWGQSSVVNNNTITVTLPLTFPNAFYSIQVTPNVGGQGATINAVITNTSSFTLNYPAAAAATPYWLAIGK